ncbi:MAG: substrate-binding domain-containing protein, partial [Pasteurella oralis]|nr:substrate-binding domain-containing protein [Pasteurella oralis]
LDLNHDILMFDSYESQEIEEHSVRRLIEYNAKAIILSAISTDKDYKPSYIEQLEKLNIPVILLDRELGEGRYSGIYIDNINCGEVAANYINKNQYDEIVVVAGPKNSNVSMERLNGFLGSVKHKNKVNVIHADFFIDEAYFAVKKILANNTKYYGFVGLNNQISLGILKACLEQHLVYKQHFDLFSIDHLPYSENYGFNISCVNHNLYEMAYQAINMAIRAITKENSNLSKIIVRSNVVEY